MSTAIDSLLYLPGMYRIECELAYYLVRLARSNVPHPTPIIDGLKFKQPLAVENACKYPISILTGNPGTGKTTTCKKIVESFVKAGLTGMCLSPSAKAARRIKEVLGTVASVNLPCTTIHSGLQYSVKHGGFLRNRHNQLPIDFLVLDEYPMADMELMRDLMEAITPGKTRVVLSGDPSQLPSVGPGNIGRDLIQSGIFPTVTLDTILRQGKDSGIVFNANRVLKGDPLCFVDPVSHEQFTDFFFVSMPKADLCAAAIVDWVAERMPAKYGFDPRTDIQVLSPGKKAVTGTKSLNDLLGARLNPNGERVGNFRIGDKIINTNNDKKNCINNGDVGVATGYAPKSRIVQMDFGVGAGPKGDGILELSVSNLDKIYSAWAFTVHKSQGSEFTAGIIPFHKVHSTLLFRNILFTGMTRFKKFCCLTGEAGAIDMTIMQDRVTRRSTRLETILKDLYSRSSFAA